MVKKIKSTYDEIVKDPKRQERIDREYKELLISELLIAAMANDDISVRELAQEAGVSPTIIQELKTGKRKNITLATCNRVLNAIGYQISVEPVDKNL